MLYYQGGYIQIRKQEEHESVNSYYKVERGIFMGKSRPYNHICMIQIKSYLIESHYHNTIL